MNEQNTFVCEICHEEHPIDERILFDGAELCERCLDAETTICDCCGERVWAEESVSDSEITLCRSCYDGYYTRCERCDGLIRYDDAVYFDDDNEIPYCADCAEEIRERQHVGLNSYGYKPTPIFYGNGERYFGVELEIDKGGEDSDNADNIIDLANEDSCRIYCKRDGSLVEGFEIVTHPMTLEYHQNSMPWKDILAEAVEMGYRSHQTSTCGLHVHVNRDSLGDTIDRQEQTIGRILFFVENHWQELLKFSRRTQPQMDRWAARYGRKDNPKLMREHVKKTYTGRYVCVNLCNSATIEFRMFRGTLRYNTLIATLQLVNEICEAAFTMSDEAIADLTWTDFAINIGHKDCPELVQYLKERRLYVNDPVARGEEV